jgi:hypothetical protein
MTKEKTFLTGMEEFTAKKKRLFEALKEEDSSLLAE